MSSRQIQPRPPSATAAEAIALVESTPSTDPLHAHALYILLYDARLTALSARRANDRAVVALLPMLDVADGMDVLGYVNDERSKDVHPTPTVVVVGQDADKEVPMSAFRASRRAAKVERRVTERLAHIRDSVVGSRSPDPVDPAVGAVLRNVLESSSQHKRDHIADIRRALDTWPPQAPFSNSTSGHSIPFSVAEHLEGLRDRLKELAAPIPPRTARARSSQSRQSSSGSFRSIDDKPRGPNYHGTPPSYSGSPPRRASPPRPAHPLLLKKSSASSSSTRSRERFGREDIYRATTIASAAPFISSSSSIMIHRTSRDVSAPDFKPYNRSKFGPSSIHGDRRIPIYDERAIMYAGHGRAYDGGRRSLQYDDVDGSTEDHPKQRGNGHVYNELSEDDVYEDHRRMNGNAGRVDNISDDRDEDETIVNDDRYADSRAYASRNSQTALSRMQQQRPGALPRKGQQDQPYVNSSQNGKPVGVPEFPQPEGPPSPSGTEFEENPFNPPPPPRLARRKSLPTLQRGFSGASSGSHRRPKSPPQESERNDDPGDSNPYAAPWPPNPHYFYMPPYGHPHGQFPPMYDSTPMHFPLTERLLQDTPSRVHKFQRYQGSAPDVEGGPGQSYEVSGYDSAPESMGRLPTARSDGALSDSGMSHRLESAGRGRRKGMRKNLTRHGGRAISNVATFMESELGTRFAGTIMEHAPVPKNWKHWRSFGRAIRQFHDGGSDEPSGTELATQMVGMMLTGGASAHRQFNRRRKKNGSRRRSNSHGGRRSFNGSTAGRSYNDRSYGDNPFGRIASGAIQGYLGQNQSRRRRASFGDEYGYSRRDGGGRYDQGYGGGRRRHRDDDSDDSDSDDGGFLQKAMEMVVDGGLAGGASEIVSQIGQMVMGGGGRHR